MFWFVHIAILIGLLLEAPGFSASSRKKKVTSSNIKAATVSYVWQEGDTLSSALFSIGIGHSDKTKARLYGNQGWVARNLDFSQKTIGDWEQLTPGSSVTLWVPVTWPGATPISSKVVVKAASAAKTELKEAPVLLQQALTPKSIDSKNIVLSAKKSPRFQALEPPFPMQRPVFYKEVMESLIQLSPPHALNLSRPQAKKRHVPIAIKTQQNHLEKSEEGQGILAIIIVITIFSFGLYSLRFQRKYRNYKRMRQSANAYLARLIGAEDTMPEQSSLFEIMVLNTEDLSKSWASYEVMGYYQADCVLLSTIKQSWLDAASKNFPYPALPPDQFACFARFIIVSPQILVQILTLASSLSLQRATLRQLVAHMMEIPPDSQKKGSMSAGLQDFLETIPKSREKLPLRDDVKKCIHWLESLPSQSATTPTQVA